MKVRKYFTAVLLWMLSQSILFGQINGHIYIDSVNDKKPLKAGEIVGLAVPSAMVIYGLISLGDNGIREIDYNTKNSLEKNNRFWHIKTDDYLQYAPAVATYAMKLCKVESTHNLLDMTILYGISSLIAGGLTQGSKIIFNRERPDKSNSRSFPSGHTQTAFVAAEFLHQEFKDKSVWISIGGYSVATFVGIARIYNNKHWLSDVVAGAGIGIISTKAVYWAYPHFRKKTGEKDKSPKLLIVPTHGNGNTGLALSYTF